MVIDGHQKNPVRKVRGMNMTLSVRPRSSSSTRQLDVRVTMQLRALLLNHKSILSLLL